MKKVLSLLVIFSCLWQSNLSAQEPSWSLLPIMREADEYIQRLEERDYLIDRIEFDLLIEGYYRNSDFLFYGEADREYVLVGFGQQGRIADIDLKIFSPSNNDTPVIEGNAPGNEERLWFKPSTTGYHTIRITGNHYAPGRDRGRYCLIIYHEI